MEKEITEQHCILSGLKTKIPLTRMGQTKHLNEIKFCKLLTSSTVYIV